MQSSPGTIPPLQDSNAQLCNQHTVSHLKQQWHSYMHQGSQCHQQRSFTQAIRYFIKALKASESLVTRSDSHPLNGVEMAYSASHNLAASYNSCGKGIVGKQVLQKLHDQLITITQQPQYNRGLRLNALSFLDKSLFSLASQLAYINQVDSIHNIINNTEAIAKQAEINLRIAQ